MITLKTMPETREQLRVLCQGSIGIEGMMADILDDLEKVSTAYEALLAACRERGISFDGVEV